MMTAKEAFDILTLDYECDEIREKQQCSCDCDSCKKYVELSDREAAVKRLYDFVDEVIKLCEGANKNG